MFYIKKIISIFVKITVFLFFFFFSISYCFSDKPLANVYMNTSIIFYIWFFFRYEEVETTIKKLIGAILIIFSPLWIELYVNWIEDLLLMAGLIIEENSKINI